MKLRIGHTALAAALLLVLPLLIVSTATAQEPRVTLCHATNDVNSPYELITVPASAAYHAHIVHHAGADIVPPFQFDSDKDGTPETHSSNWDATGQAIFAAGCMVVPPPPPPPLSLIHI